MRSKPHPEAGKIVVLCDFDGTVTPADTSNFLYTQFAGAGTQYAEMWDRGEISTPEELSQTFATIRASREEMETALEAIPLDPGFLEFYSYCRACGYEIAVISDGLEWWIRVILNHYDLGEIPIYANVIQFTSDGFRFHHPWFNPEHPEQGTSKPTIIRDFQNRGRQVLYIGDGKSDFQAAGQADRVFAKSALITFCRENKIPHTPFEGFTDLLRIFQKEVTIKS